MIVDPRLAEYLKSRSADRNGRLTSRLDEISGMVDVPDKEEILIGSARETRGVVLFADLVASTRLAQRYSSENEKMLATLNLLLPTLMDAVHYFTGEFEKNTGDGVLAYFGMGSDASEEYATTSAVASAYAMLWAVSNVVNPALEERGLQTVQITVGADLGDVLLARIGLHRVRNVTPMVAVGLVANRASKIQGTAKPAQARFGEDLFNALPREWKSYLDRIAPGSPWPFRVQRDPAVVQREREQARLDAELAAAQRREAATRNDIFATRPPGPPPLNAIFTTPPLGSPPLLASVFPRTVETSRHYLLYKFKQPPR